jgi:hypothetical protein
MTTTTEIRTTLQFGDVLDNGATVIHYTPGEGGFSGHVLAKWGAEYVVWRCPREISGRLGGVGMGRYCGTLTRAVEVYRQDTGVTV